MSSVTPAIASSLLKDLYSIPSFSDLQKAIESKTIISNPASIIGGVFAQATTTADLEESFSVKTADVLKRLPKDSIVYRYLALSQDFKRIKQRYLQLRATGVSNYVEGILSDESLQLLLLKEYESRLKSAEPTFHQVDSTFEFVSLLDSLYLQALASAVKDGNSYLQSVVKVKIDNYHIMSALRLTQLGRSRSEIERLFVKSDGRLVSTYSLEKLEYRDVVSEIGMQLGLKPEHTSVTEIETFLLNKEISTINKAKFHGVDGERIIQYFEQLRFFISDVKVAFAANAMDLPYEDVAKRLVTYDAI